PTTGSGTRSPSGSNAASTASRATRPAPGPRSTGPPARPWTSGITTSAPSTCCWRCSAVSAAWPRRSSSTSARGATPSNRSCSTCSPRSCRAASSRGAADAGPLGAGPLAVVTVPAETAAVDFSTMMALEPHGTDGWVGAGPRYPWGGLYGGQIVAQGLRAAASTVDPAFRVHSLHAYFIRLGDHTEPIRFEV